MDQNHLERLSRANASFTSDSRLAGPGAIFVALKGEKTDGHRFVDEVLAKGCPAVVVSTTFAAGRSDSRFVAVEDTHLAHRALAALQRQKFNGRVVAIAGSSGKTTTKEFIYELLRQRFRCIKTEKSQNGELGIPRTLERLNANVDIAVVEVGIDGPGDMIRHANLVRPDLTVLTSIGEEHLNLLKDIETVFSEERIIFDVTLARGGHCFAPRADAYLARFAGTASVQLVEASEIGNFRITLAHPYARQNAALAIAVARHLGLTAPEIQAGLDALAMPPGRGQEFALAGGGTLLADHYNSNPSSLKAGLVFASARARELGKPLTLVLGDMLDLGDETTRAHDSMVDAIRAARPDGLVLIGPHMTALAARVEVEQTLTFRDSAEAAEAVNWASLESDYVLAKGSRGMALERAIRKLVPELG